MPNDPKITHIIDEMFGTCSTCHGMRDNCPRCGSHISTSQRRATLMNQTKVTIRQYRYGLSRSEQAQALEDMLRDMGFQARVQG